MLSQNIKAICEGGCYIQQIAILEGKVNTKRHTCKKGEKVMDRFFYITNGVFHICEIGGKEIVATEGDLLYLPADVEYTSFWEQMEGSTYISFIYNLYGLKGEMLHLNSNITPLISDKNGEIYKLLKQCVDSYIKNEKYAGLALQSQFYKLLYTVLRRENRKAIKRDKKTSEIYRAIVYLEDNYMFEITTDELAEMCNMSVATFRRMFKKYKRISPMKYKQQLRMAHAKNMLESGVYTVSEVAEIMGCTDLSHFNRQYFSEFSINPSVSKPTVD